MKCIYLLKDLAQASGYSTHTIKYYLQLGLFQEMGRSPLTNFRYFDDTSVNALKEIRKLQGNGFSLKEIKAKIKI
jgi:DNA-binding transcriptional MerR regulator